MSVKYTKEVACCRECPCVTNNAREHDDPFTSGPSNVWWFCNFDSISIESVDISDVRKIAKNCPLRDVSK